MEPGKKRVNIVIDDELHRLLKIEVAKESTTIAKFVAEAIKEKIERSNKE